MSASAIGRRVKSGRLIARHRGVYALGHVPEEPESAWAAAVLACRPHAALSRLSAAVCWEMLNHDGPLPSVTVPVRRNPRHPGIDVMRADLHRDDLTHHNRLPITSPARTLVDIEPLVTPHALRTAYREAQFLRILSLQQLIDALGRLPRPRLAKLLDLPRDPVTPIEDQLLDVLRAHRIPPPERQVKLPGKRIDFVWERERVVVETDGWQSHGTRLVHQQDVELSNSLQLDGWIVLRFTWSDVSNRRRKVARTIRAALRARSSGPP